MCSIVGARRGKKYMYIDIEDGDWFYVKKLSHSSFDYAVKFKNPDFLNMVSKNTSERDLSDAWDAKEVTISI